MCGISGIIRFDKKAVSKDQLKLMMQRIKHRGPDGDGYYITNNIGLGVNWFNTSEIIGTNLQPMTDSTQRYTIIKNGVIYNHSELREELERMGYVFHSQTDTEVVLNGYHAWGREVLDKLNGMFAIAIYDSDQHTIFIARDRFGVKPLYYCITNEEFIFASEIPALLAIISASPSANERAIFDYLVFNRTDQAEQTFFNGIYKLQHGCCMTLDCSQKYTKEQLPIIKWYNLVDRIQGKTIKKDNDEYMRLLTHAIQMRLSSDHGSGVCLSGGLDSSAIASALINVLQESNVHSFSAVYGKECHADESSYIDCYQGIVPNMHYVYPNADTLYDNIDNYVRIHAEPTPTTSPFAQYCVMQEARKFVRVTLDGQGADETLSGYEYIPGLYYKTLLVHFKWITLVKELIQYARLHKSMRHIKYMVFFLLPSRIRTKVRVAQRGYVNPEFVARHKDSIIADQLYGAHAMQEMLIRHLEYKLEHLLKWGDRNATAFSIESRQPFLDKDLVEYSLMLEDGAKVCNGYTKYILRDVMRGIMPEPVRTRVDKMGFSVPQDEWFRTEKFQIFIMDILQSKTFAERGFIVQEEAINLYKKHLAGEVNVSKDIWKWINLELWFREFIDKSKKNVQ